MRLAIIGAGSVGGNLGKALSGRGHTIRFGVRDPDKVRDLVAACGAGADAVGPREAAQSADAVVLAVPWAAALGAVAALGDLSGKVLIDCTNPVAWDDGPVIDPSVQGSGAQMIAAACPGARVVKAFSTHGAELLLQPQVGNRRADTFVCGDDPEARALAARLAQDVGLGVVDAGPLRNANLLEHLAILWIYLAIKGGAGRNAGFALLRP